MFYAVCMRRMTVLKQDLLLVLVPVWLRDNTSSSPSTHILMKETTTIYIFILLVLSQIDKLALSSTEILFHLNL